MNYIQTEIDGVWVIEPKVFNDARGYVEIFVRCPARTPLSER